MQNQDGEVQMLATVASVALNRVIGVNASEGAALTIIQNSSFRLLD